MRLRTLLWDCCETYQTPDAQRDWLRIESEKQLQHKCLCNTGNVGEGFIQNPESTEMKEREEFHKDKDRKIQQAVTQTVYIDGGCIKVPGVTRAGYGVYRGEGEYRSETRALRGKEQTEQRAEVAAVARALHTTLEINKSGIGQ